MNSSRSVKWIRTLLLVLFAVCAVSGVSIMGNARGFSEAKAASNYVSCYTVKHVATYDGNSETKWTNVTPTPVDKGSVLDGNYALLETPTIEVVGEKTRLTWFSVRFVLGNDTNRVTTLTQSATHNNKRLQISEKTQINETSTIPYHEQWTQDFFGVVENGSIIAEDIDATIVTSAKTFLNDYVTTYAATTNKITSYVELNGIYTIAYDYVPENQARIHEEFSFYMLTSDVYSVNSKILINNATPVTTSEATSDNYNRKFVYQFDKVASRHYKERHYKLDGDTKVYQDEDSASFNALTTEEMTERVYENDANYSAVSLVEQTENTQLLYPTFSYNPEHFVISYSLTQYNYVQRTELTFAKRIENAKTIATLKVVSTFNNGDPTQTTLYVLEINGANRTYKRALTANESDAVENNKDTPLTFDGTNFNVTLTLRNPGLYAFSKLINLKLSDIEFRTLDIEEVTTTDQNATFNDEALWILGYNATYASEGVTQKTLFNNELENTYISDFSFLLENSLNTINATEGTIDDTAALTKLQTYATSIKEYLNSNPTVVKATTNQAPVIFSSNFYLPNFTSKVSGFAYNKTAGTLVSVDKTTRFTDVGEYYVLMVCEQSSLTNTTNDTKMACQLFAFDVTSSPVKPTIYTTTTTENYYNDINKSSIDVNQYTNKNVFLSWTTNGPFEHSVKVEYYFSSTFDTNNPVYTEITNLVREGNTTYSPLFYSPLYKNTAKSGYYKFKITSNKNTVGYYSFYIDGDPISGIYAYNTTNNARITNTLAGMAVTNKSFAWTWTDKTSGAKISATRYWAQFATQENYNNLLIESLEAITTDAQVLDFNTGIKYKKLEGDKTLALSQILKNAGIYVLFLEDEAGNTATFVTMLDNTEPTIYVTKHDDNQATEINDQTLNASADVYWEKWKAILISPDSMIISSNTAIKVNESLNFSVGDTLIKVYNNKKYLLIPNQQLDMFVDSDPAITLEESTSKVVVEMVPATKSVVISQDGETLKTILLQDGEQSTDAMIKFLLTDKIENTSSKTLTFSFDQSNLKMYSFSSDSNITNNTNNTDLRWVPLNFGTNRNIETIRWQNPENENIEIDSIKVTYYPIDFTSTTTYPYASSGQTFVLLGTGATVGRTSYTNGSIVEFISAAFNTTTVEGKNLTNAGKYVVERTYTEASRTYVEELGDDLVRTYTFYVDRNSVIDESYAKYQISFGYNASDYPEIYRENYDKSTTNLNPQYNYQFGTVESFDGLASELSGNRLDVSINTPTNYFGYKFTPQQITSELRSMIEENYSKVFQTIIVVQYKLGTQDSTSSISTNYYRYYEGEMPTGTKYLNASGLDYAFKNPGFYRVCLLDLTNSNSILSNDPEEDLKMFKLQYGETSYTYSPNYKVFCFEITAEAPSGEFKSAPNIQSNFNTITNSITKGVTHFYTNDDYVVFTFSASNTSNNAKIAYQNIQVKKTESKFGTTQATVTYDNVPFDSAEFNTSFLNGAEQPRIYLNSTEEKYYLILPTVKTNSNFNAQPDCWYEITLKYIQTDTYKEFNNKTYAKNVFTLFIDHTKPYENLFNLIDNDNYLSEIEEMFPGTISKIKNHLDDNDFEFLKHYVFTVTPDFYLTYSKENGNADTETAHYRKYQPNTYNGTTATEISSKDYYPDNSTPFDHYSLEQRESIVEGQNSILIKTLEDTQTSNNIVKKKYRPFIAGNYYDVIERDNSGNYRVYTIYVSGTEPAATGNDSVNNSNLLEKEFAEADVLMTLNLMNTTFDENGQEQTTTDKAYWGLNAANAGDIQTEITYSNMHYATSTFQDISTNGKYDILTVQTGEGEEQEETQVTSITSNDALYWLILKYTLTTNKGAETKTIIYFPSADINSGRETSNHIPDLKTMLGLGNNSAVTFITSRQDLLDTLNSLIVDAKNQTQNNTGAKFELEFINKLQSNPYYANNNVFGADGVALTDSNHMIILESKNLSIAQNFDLTINIPGLEIVNTVNDFIESTNDKTFILKIPASNVSTWIEQIYLNGTSPLISNGRLNSNTFSMNQSYRFKFADNFGRTRTYTFPIDSEYVQNLIFSAGSSLKNFNGSTYTFTCGDTSFVYDSNHLGYRSIKITNLANGETLLEVDNFTQTNTNTPTNTNTEEQTGEEESGEQQAEQPKTSDDYYKTVVGSDGKTTLNFKINKNVYYKYEIGVGSASDNLTKHTFILYTIFPTVTITDTNGGNMIPENQDEQLVTSKDLLIGLIPNNQASFNPHIYLSNGNYSTEILADFDTLINENGVYTITFENEIGSYPLGTIKFTRKTYDISIYGVYYNDNNTYIPLVKRSQGYRFDLSTIDQSGSESSGSEGEQSQTPASTIRTMDRFFFLSSSDNDWNNIVVLLNENKQLELVRNSLTNANYVAEDPQTRTRIYHIKGNGAYKIDTYFAITRIPTSTTDLVSDFRINGNKPLTTNLTQLYPTTVESSDELSATLTWNPSYVYGEETINDFYILELWLNGTYVGSYTSGNLELKDSGTYTIKLHDILGQYKIFGAGSDSYNITIYRDVVFSVNDNNPIQNATFNSDVKITISNITQYNSANFEFIVTRNSSDFEAELVDGEYTFTTPGVYIVNMSGLLKGMGNRVDKLTSEYRFTIISSNEARLNYEFAKRSGYSITKIVKNGEELEDITPLYSLSLDATSNGQFGKGRYEITVSIKGEGLIPTMDYTYTIWINNEEAILNTTREWGSSSIMPFTIKLNPSVVYTRIGNCYVTVNGKTVMEINESNKDENNEISETFTTPGVYVIQMYSESGNLLSSQRITIKEPLNTVAIVLIVLAAVVAVALILMFVLIRKRQKVK